jgi:hypothetical protein
LPEGEAAKDWKAQAVQNVAGDSVATVAIVAIFAGTGLLYGGFEPWIACGFPGLMCILYQTRSLFDHRHKQRMAEIDVDRIDAEKGKATRERAKKALARRRGKDGTR